MNAAIGHQSTRVRELEFQLQLLQAKHGVDGESKFADASLPSTNGQLDVAAVASSSATPVTPTAPEEVGDADEAAAIAALKQRLQKEVDANITEQVDEPEDPTTL